MINEFMARLGADGLSKPTMFMVEITKVPNSMRSVEGMLQAQDGMRFYAETAEFPGQQILTQDNRIYDMASKFAYGKIQDDLNLTFRVDRDFTVKRFLDAWIDSVYNRKNGNVFYKSDYVGTIVVSQLAEDGQCHYSIELEDAFPTQVNQMGLDWGNKGTHHRVTCIFNYVRWSVIIRDAIFAQHNFQTKPPGNLALDVYDKKLPGGPSDQQARDFIQFAKGTGTQMVSRLGSTLSNYYSSLPKL